MRLICWNINGLRSIVRRGLAEFITIHQPDILCLQEIKIDESSLVSELRQIGSLAGEFSFAAKKGYSGVATYFSDKFKFELNSRGIKLVEFDSEGRFLLHKADQFFIYNVYFPSGTTGELRQNFKYKFLDAFLDHIKSLPSEIKDRLIICGDFNICHKPIDIHHPVEAEKRQLSGFLPAERAWMDKFVEAGFVDTFRLINGQKPQAYTWWTFRANARAKNLGWRIDYFFVSAALAKRVKAAGIMEQVAGSDHCPIFLELD